MYTHKWTRSAGTGNCIGKYTQAYFIFKIKKKARMYIITTYI
jgi:hypothetical protein